MRLQSLTIKSGQQVPLSTLTVLVGPNNVGKSQTLRDVLAKLTAGAQARTIILDSVQIEKPTSFDELLVGLDVKTDPNNPSQEIVSGIASNLTNADQFAFSRESFEQQFKQSTDLAFIQGNLSRLRVCLLDASLRLRIAESGPSHNPSNPATTSLQGLFQHHHLEVPLQRVFKKTFNMNVKLDYSGMQTLALRVAEAFPSIPEDPRKAYTVMNKYNLLDAQGDGFRSFVGVVLSLLLFEGRVVLLDEPEAFLHPAQAKQMGSWIAEYSRSMSGQVIVATHNANFLMGIISQGANVSIFRLNRSQDKTTYKLMPPDVTASLAKSPLLSSQRILESIFHKGVVVCEGDADRAIYETVATREIKSRNVMFVNAHNKQTIKDVVQLLVQAGVLVCGVTDIDILNSEHDLKKLLAAFGITNSYSAVLHKRKELAQAVAGMEEKEIVQQILMDLRQLVQELDKGEHTLSGARAALERVRSESTRWSQVKRLGIEGFPKGQQATAQQLVDDLANFGLFVVPVGELEGWIDVGTRQKNKWIVRALEALSENRCTDDLKEFVMRILAFLGESVNPEEAEPDDRLAATSL